MSMYLETGYNLNRLHIAIHCGHVQRCAQVLDITIWVCSGMQQSIHTAMVFGLHSHKQWRLTLNIWYVNIGTIHYQQIEAVCVSTYIEIRIPDLIFSVFQWHYYILSFREYA